MKDSSRSWRHRAEVLLAAHDAQENAGSYIALAKQHRSAGNVPLAMDMQRIANAYRDSAAQYKRDAKRLLREWRATSRALTVSDRSAPVVTQRARPVRPGRKTDGPRGIPNAPAPPVLRPRSVRMIFRKYLRRLAGKRRIGARLQW